MHLASRMYYSLYGKSICAILYFMDVINQQTKLGDHFAQFFPCLVASMLHPICITRSILSSSLVIFFLSYLKHTMHCITLHCIAFHTYCTCNTCMNTCSMYSHQFISNQQNMWKTKGVGSGSLTLKAFTTPRGPPTLAMSMASSK